jgi:hypothetical protein
MIKFLKAKIFVMLNIYKIKNKQYEIKVFTGIFIQEKFFIINFK